MASEPCGSLRQWVPLPSIQDRSSERQARRSCPRTGIIVADLFWNSVQVSSRHDHGKENPWITAGRALPRAGLADRPRSAKHGKLAFETLLVVNGRDTQGTYCRQAEGSSQSGQDRPHAEMRVWGVKGAY